ncbi:MAG: GIY-YIG nuclease family protein [Nitrospirota bacterium]
MPFFVYILKSEKNGRSYIGHTADLQKRLIEHNNGKSISTRSGKPWKLTGQFDPDQLHHYLLSTCVNNP